MRRHLGNPAYIGIKVLGINNIARDGNSTGPQSEFLQ